MKKLFRILLILILIFGVIYFAYRYFLSGKSSFQSVYLVPPDAVLIIESDAAFDAWGTIINSDAWNKLSSNEALAGLQEDLNSIDSLLNKKRFLLKILGRRKVMMSMHEYQDQKYDYLYIINIGKLAQLRNPRSWLSSLLGDSWEITERIYNQQNIYELLDKDSGELYIFTFLKDKAVFSTNYMLVERSVDELQKMTLGRDLNFINVSKKTSGKGLFNLYINYPYFTDYLESKIGKSSEFTTGLGNELFYSGFSFDMDTDGNMSLEGYTSINDTLPSFFSYILHAGHGTFQCRPVVPAQVASMVKISFDDIIDYYNQSLSYLNEEDLVSFQNNQQKIEKKLKISVKDNFLSWIDDEIVLLQTKPSNLGRKNEFALVIHARNYKDAEDNLYFLGKQVERNTPVKVKEVEYEGFTIRYISFPGLLRILFGKMLDKIEKPYYTIIDEFVIFSNHPQTLKNIIDDFRAGNTLENSTDFYSFSNQFSKRNTVLTYLDLPVMFTNLEEFVSPATWNNLKKNKPYIVSFPRAGIEIDSDGNLLHFLFKAEYSDEVEEYRRQVFDTYSFMKLFSAQSPTQVGEENEWYDPEIVINDLDAAKAEGMYEDGQLKYSVGLKNGRMHGNYKEYYPDGVLKIKGKYKDDKRDGEWKFFDEKGNLVIEISFTDGNPTLQ